MLKESVRKRLPEKLYESLSTIKRIVLSPRSIPIELIRGSIARKTISPKSILDLKSIALVERMDYERSEIFLNVDSECELSLRLHSCKKEPDTVEWIENFIKEGDVLYDVGANVGPYSLVAAKSFAGKVRIYAFEPAFFNFAQLCRNIQLNGAGNTITPIALALSDCTGIGEFNYHNLVSGGSLHVLGQPIDHQGKLFEPVCRQSILSCTIDDLIERFGLPVPNHIKIDVDGREFSVLEGAKETLTNALVRSLVVEVLDGENESVIVNFLAGKGFRLHSKHKRLTPGMSNCIFSRGLPP
jgi:FkbM family methyltransferase